VKQTSEIAHNDHELAHNDLEIATIYKKIVHNALKQLLLQRVVRYNAGYFINFDVVVR